MEEHSNGDDFGRLTEPKPPAELKKERSYKIYFRIRV
jgi:hypothetical protein